MPIDLNEEVPFFREGCQYVLFSGSSLSHKEEDAYRHLNDLFFILILLMQYSVKPENIVLVIDIEILNVLDRKTHNKLLPNIHDKTFNQVFAENCGVVIDLNDFSPSFKKDGHDLTFFASGHGAINGLNNLKTGGFITSDFFEEIATEETRTTLIMSQCYAGAFHHLDTRKNICVIGASEYQSSLSLDLEFMLGIFPPQYKSIISNNLQFFQNIAINPFIFSFFCSVFFHKDIIINSKKHMINIYKYTAAGTYDILSRLQNHLLYEAYKAESSDRRFIDNEQDILQSSFMLNKILAARQYIH